MRGYPDTDPAHAEPAHADTPITSAPALTLDGVVADRQRDARAWIGYYGAILAAESMTLELVPLLDILINLTKKGEDLS